MAVLIVIAGISCDYGQPPDPPPPPNLRGELSTVANIDMSISGVKPGMTKQEVEQLLGPGQRLEDGDVSYQDGAILCYFLGDGAFTVQGTTLMDGEKVFFKKGQPRQKVESILGKPQRRHEGRVGYDGLEPDLWIKYKHQRIEYLELH